MGSRGGESQEILLCTSSGMILSTYGILLKQDIIGYLLDPNKIKGMQKPFLSTEFFYDYTIFHSETEGIHVQEIITLCEGILDIFTENESEYKKIIDNLDYLNNALMMCDKNCNIMFANSNFCENFHIKNRDEIIGMNITDISEKNGIQISAIETNSSKLKMYDVIKSGKPTLDWTVRMESKFDKNYMQLVSNDMLPTFDEKGKVTGLVEISRSQQQEMKKTRKLMGLNAEYVFDDVIGKTNLICKKIKLAKEFAGNRGTVLITGESGVGKEIFAQSIHNESSRRKGPFIALNCANFPTELIESELFGYVEGAFTGASKKGQVGKIELANGGTLFLDEIGELPYYFQSKLLRVLETWTITRIGGPKEIPVDVRLIAATNRNLPEMISSGLFRQDLYYRLQVLTIEIPPLRERIEDVPLIANHFLRISAAQNGHEPKKLSDAAVNKLMAYNWPGNARELKNIMSRIDLLSKDDLISGESIDFALFAKESMPQAKAGAIGSCEDRINNKKMEVDMAYINLINEALDITDGNKKNAAELLGISRKTIYRMLEKYNIK